MKQYQIGSDQVNEVYDVCRWMALSDDIVAVDLDREVERWETERELCVDLRLVLLDEGARSKKDKAMLSWMLALQSITQDDEIADIEALTGICKRYFRDYPW